MSDEIFDELNKLHAVEAAAANMIATTLLKRAAAKSSDLVVTAHGRTYRFVQTAGSQWIFENSEIVFRATRDQIDPTRPRDLRQIIGDETRISWPVNPRQSRLHLLADAQLLGTSIKHAAAVTTAAAQAQQTLREMVAGASRTGRVGVIVDVSGSMGVRGQAQQLGQALLDSGAHAQAALVSTHVVLVGSARLVAAALPKAFDGGTDFRTSIEAAWQQMGRPESLVLVTDADSTHWPTDGFPVPTIVALTPGPVARGHRDFLPGFVRKVAVPLQLPPLQARGPELAA